MQAAGLSSPITVFGLANATTHQCTVLAHNSAGNGPASTPFLVTLPSAPDAPVVSAVTPGDTAATIAFTPPANNGGSAIIDFSATCNPGAIVRTNTGSPITYAAGSLANGTVYTCTLAARNAVGTGAASPSFQFTPASVPGAPVITSVIGGDGQASVFFTPPASNGGAPITSYRAQCDSPGVTGSTSPITVTPLANNVAVNCSVFATNAIGNGAPSATVAVTPSAASALTPVAVYSRKTHGAAGDFNLQVDTAPNVVTSEPRLPTDGHLIVFQFNVPVSNEGTASVTPVGTTAVTKSGYEVQVKLINVPDNQRADVVLSGVNGSGVSVTARLGFLIGDVNNSKAVNASDISAVKSRSGQSTNLANFQFDLNTTGAISPQDVSAAKARSGLVLPP